MNSKASIPSPSTRERVLDTAERLFAMRGFAETSVREITDAAGANLGAVNYYFRSKENLYAAVFARRAALLREPMEAAAGEAAGLARRSPDRALRALGRAFLAPHEDHGASLRLFRLFAREVVEPCLPRRLVERQFLAPAIGAITKIVRRARPDLPETTARACAHAFFAQLGYVAKSAAVARKAVDEELEHAVHFTVAAVMHMKAGTSARARRATPRKRS